MSMLAGKSQVYKSQSKPSDPSVVKKIVLFCEYCGFRDHVMEDCYQLIGYPLTSKAKGQDFKVIKNLVQSKDIPLSHKEGIRVPDLKGITDLNLLLLDLMVSIGLLAINLQLGVRDIDYRITLLRLVDVHLLLHLCHIFS